MHSRHVLHLDNDMAHNATADVTDQLVIMLLFSAHWCKGQSQRDRALAARDMATRRQGVFQRQQSS